MSVTRSVAGLLACLWLVPVAVEAQPRIHDWPGRIEVVAAGVRSSGHHLGSATADLLSNQVPRSSPTPLFTANTELRPSVAVDVSVGYRLTRTFTVEGFIARSRPVVETTVTNDLELTVGGSARESLTQYRLGGGVVLDLPAVSFVGGRARPFVVGGAGYLREDSSGGTSSSTGTVYHLGAGIRVHLIERANARILKVLGVKGDVRVHRRDGGFEFEDRRRTFVTASVGLLVVL